MCQRMNGLFNSNGCPLCGCGPASGTRDLQLNMFHNSDGGTGDLPATGRRNVVSLLCYYSELKETISFMNIKDIHSIVLHRD